MFYSKIIHKEQYMIWSSIWSFNQFLNSFVEKSHRHKSYTEDVYYFNLDISHHSSFSVYLHFMTSPKWANSRNFVKEWKYCHFLFIFRFISIESRSAQVRFLHMLLFIQLYTSYLEHTCAWCFPVEKQSENTPI